MNSSSTRRGWLMGIIGAFCGLLFHRPTGAAVDQAPVGATAVTGRALTGSFARLSVHRYDRQNRLVEVIDNPAFVRDWFKRNGGMGMPTVLRAKNVDRHDYTI